MVNGNYVLYGDRPSSESETVDDHVHARTAERRTKRKTNKATKDPHTHKRGDPDNETDAVKFEKKVKEPKLLRYVPTTDVEENFITEKFETYDLKPTEEPARRHTFTKKPKNPADGSVNYAYSRSSSSCSSPNLPTISEHGEQYGTYRVRSPHSPSVTKSTAGYENKLEKYFCKPRELKAYAAKGSHPDSLYRVPSDSSSGAEKMIRGLRLLRWPLALFTVCVALAAFVYFLMPVNMDVDSDTVNGTYWEESISEAQSHGITEKRHGKPILTKSTKTSEIDFYEATSIPDTITEADQKRKLPIEPVFPTHVSLEVQYGNENADTNKARSSKSFKDSTAIPSDSTLKPHITQKPEKPLAIYFNGGNSAVPTSFEAAPTAESFANAETSNDIARYKKNQSAKYAAESSKPEIQVRKEVAPTTLPSKYLIPNPNTESKLPPEVQEFYGVPLSNDVRFTSGHSKLFGISMEDAENMKSTTQNSLYNTRVSPTLPTWRDKDDVTTKKYPVNGNFDVPQCRSTRLPLCRGVLPYDLAGAPATVGEMDVTALLPQIEYLVSTNCSQRVRHFACALLEPECSPPPYAPKLPCYSFCRAIVDQCESMIPTELAAMFACSQYSTSDCTNARLPCFLRELACGDGSCVPRDWVCDGTRDCPDGEDETPCESCDPHEYRCDTGLCIAKRWLCDGYADCPSGEDERKELCSGRKGYQAPAERDEVEPGEEIAGSAPALSVRKPNRLPAGYDRSHHRESDSSKELLMTSDSNNAFRRNFTRRPSPSRLTPYKRPIQKPVIDDTDSIEKIDIPKAPLIQKAPVYGQKSSAPLLKQMDVKEPKKESSEDINIGDLGLFEDIEKEKDENKEKIESNKKHNQRQDDRKPSNRYTTTEAPSPSSEPTRLDKTLSNLEKVIDGASLLKKAVAETQKQKQADAPDSPESTAEGAGGRAYNGAYNGAHASPCPSGELRCVDGRCITLAQLCDGTIDCSDHADEDNCYT